MSSPTTSTGKPNGAETTWREGLSDHQVNMTLVKRMGGKHGYNPIPPAQHGWQLEPGVPEGVHRIWSFLCAHTIHFGHRSEYAITSDGQELYIENVASALAIEESNARTYWRWGCRRGIWRNGTPKEGKRRLYLCGEVTPQAAEEDADENQKVVCTYHFSSHILNKIKELTPERQKEFWSAYARHDAVRKDVLADLVAVSRMVLDRDEDTLLRSFGLERERQNHTRKADPDEIRARAERMASIEGHVERYVRTIEATVQSSPSALHIVANGSVQGDFDGPTLLGSETAREGQSGRAASVSNGHARPLEGAPSQDGKKSGYLPAAESRVPSEAELAATKTVIEQVGGLQNALPKRFESGWRVLDPENKGDHAWALKVARAAEPAEILDFVADLKQRITSRKGLGHQVGPGLILEWAGDFHRGAAARRQLKAQHEATERQLRENEAQRQAARDRDDKLTVWMEDTWERMSAEERDRRLAAETAVLKTDPHWRDWPQTRRTHQAEVRARHKLKQELAAEQAAKGATS